MAPKATRRKKTTAPEPEVTEVEETDEDAFEELDDETAAEAGDDEDDDLEELEETEEDEAEEEEAPKPKKAKKAKGETKPKAKKADAPAFGSTELAAHITSTTGQAYDARSVRMLLRKLAKTEGSPLQRAVGEDRGRYSFSGPEDPAVKAIVQMVKSGEAQQIKRAGLDAVKEKAAAKKKAAAAVEEVEETPVKKTKSKSTMKAGPAKATPAKKKAKA